MAGIKFKKRDLNRYRKVYPFIREAPVESFMAGEAFVIEVGDVEFANASSATYTFNEKFTSAPTITAVAVDSNSNNSANVNIFVSSVSTTSVTLESSQNFSGKVSFHVILVGA